MFKSFIPDRASIVRNIISYGIAHLFWAGLGIFVWFAPQKWIAFVIEGLPEFFTPYRARVLLIGAAVIVFLMTLRPRPQQKHQSPSWLFRWPRKSKLTDIQESTPLNNIPLIELLKEAEKCGWQFTADESQHIFHFTSALRDAGSTREIQFWGREVQHIQDHTRDKPLTEIESDMWKGALIRPLSCLENSSDGTTRIVSDNFRTAVDREALQGDLRKDIHLNRKQALSWLQHQVPQSLGDQSEERVPLGLATRSFYRDNRDMYRMMLEEGLSEDTDELLNSLAWWLISGEENDPFLDVFGTRESDEKEIKIADEDLSESRVVNGATALHSTRRVGGDNYSNLKIRQQDFEDRSQQLVEAMQKQMNGNG